MTATMKSASKALVLLMAWALAAGLALCESDSKPAVEDRYYRAWYQRNVLRNLAEAADLFGAVAAEHPDRSDRKEIAGRARLGQGECLAELGRLEEAVAALEQAEPLLAGEPRLLEEARGLKRTLQERLASSGSTDWPVTVFVEAVAPEGPAARLAFRAGDILVSYDGTPAASVRDILQRSARRPAGEDVPIVVRRGGEEVRLGCKGGDLGLRLAQSIGRGLPVQIETRNCRGIAAALLFPADKAAETLRELAGRPDLSPVEQAMLADAALGLDEARGARKALETLAAHPRLSDAARGHLVARLGSAPPELRDAVLARLTSRR